jgi:hypothetical protein
MMFGLFGLMQMEILYGQEPMAVVTMMVALQFNRLLMESLLLQDIPGPTVQEEVMFGLFGLMQREILYGQEPMAVVAMIMAGQFNKLLMEDLLLQEIVGPMAQERVMFGLFGLMQREILYGQELMAVVAMIMVD